MSCLNESLLKEIAAAIAEQNAFDSMTSDATVDERQSESEDLSQTEAGIVICHSDVEKKALIVDFMGSPWYQGFYSIEDAEIHLSNPRTEGDLLTYSRYKPRVYSLRFVLERAVLRGARGIALTLDPRKGHWCESNFTFIEAPK